MYSMLLTLALPSENNAEIILESEDSAEEQEITVIGSRLSEPAPVITNNAIIDKTLAVESLDYLNRLPDVRATSTGGVGGSSFVSIRGAEPNFAQILIDGVRVSNPSSSQGGGFDFAQLDPELIGQISIIPSSRSAVHGSDALSGVINVQLKSADRDGLRFSGSLNADSAASISGSLTAGYGWSDGGLVLSGGYFDSSDLSRGSQLKRGQLFARFEQDIGDWLLSLFLLNGETDRLAFAEASGGPLFAVNRELESRDTRFLITGLNLQGDSNAPIKPTLKIGYYSDNNLIDSPAISPGIFRGIPALTSDTDFDRLEITADARFRLGSGLALVTGVNFLRERAESVGTIDFGFPVPTAFNITREQTSLFAEAEWQATKALKLSLASRHDLFRQNSETTLQASVEYSVADTGLTLFGGYAEGFRLPSLFALAFPLTANPNLLPERSESWEAGSKWSDGKTELRLSLFQNNYSNLIDFDPMLFTTVNRSQTEIRGFSVAGNGEIGNALLWNVSVTYTDISSDVPLRGRPHWFGQAGLTWQLHRDIQLGATGRFNSEFFESAIPTGVIELNGHVELDAFAQWKLSDHVRLNIAVRNLTDDRFRDAVGFPNPGRIVRTRVSFQF